MIFSVFTIMINSLLLQVLSVSMSVGFELPDQKQSLN